MTYGKEIERMVLDDLMSTPMHADEGPVELDLSRGRVTFPVPPEGVIEVERTFSINVQEDAPVEAFISVRSNRIERAVEFGKAFAEPPNPVNSRKKSPYKKRPKRSR